LLGRDSGWQNDRIKLTGAPLEGKSDGDHSAPEGSNAAASESGFCTGSLDLMSHCTRVIEVYGHNQRVGVMVEFRLVTDFTAAMPEFTALAKDIAVHIAAETPASVEVLLDQRFVKAPEKSVRSLLAAVLMSSVSRSPSPASCAGTMKKSLTSRAHP
jgi:hypothetical protein